MKTIIYVAPNYHINQTYATKSLLDKGWKVIFLSQRVSPKQDYSFLKPKIIGYNFISKLLSGLFFEKNSTEEWKFLTKYGIPPVKLIKLFKREKPSLIIIRGHSLYSFFAFISTMFLGINDKCVFYTQNPINDKIRLNLRYKIVDFFFPKTEITPINGDCIISYKNKNRKFYVPLVIEKQISIVKPKTGKNIKIITVAQFQERKRILELIKVFNRLLEFNKNIELNIFGNCVTKNDEVYFENISRYITENNFGDSISLNRDISHSQVMNEYKKSDIFVLPSIREPASFSILEAMASGLPIIVSTDNGLKEYVEHGSNGYIFEKDNYLKLEQFLKNLVSNSGLRYSFGKRSLELIDEKYTPDKYYDGLIKVINHIENQ